MHFTHIAEFISFTLHDSSFRSHHIIHFTHITEFINEDPVSDKAPHGDNSSIPHHAQAAYCVSCMHLSELETERGQVPVFAAWPLGPAKYVCIDQVFHMAFLISNTVPGIFFLFLWGREKLLKTNRPRNKLKIDNDALSFWRRATVKWNTSVHIHSQQDNIFLPLPEQFITFYLMVTSKKFEPNL